MIKKFKIHKRKLISLIMIITLIFLIIIPVLSLKPEKQVKQLNPYPPDMVMELAPREMQRLVGACNESSVDIVARQNINSTVAYWFPSLCNVPTGWQYWTPDVQAWSLIKRLEVA